MPAPGVLAEWRADPRKAVRQLFRVEPDPWQDDVLQALADPSIQRYAIKACKGPGKTAVEAWFAWLFLLTRSHPKIAATSITADNLRDNLWTELATWQKHSPILEALFEWGHQRITLRSSPETWWMSARTWSRTASPEQQGEALAGLHAKNILFILDEAGSIPDAVAKTAEAALANLTVEADTEAKLLIFGNPEQTEGPLYRAFNINPERWWRYTITGDPEDPNRAPRVSVEWAREMIETWGREDPWVMSNILGLFPRGGANKLIPIELAHEAASRNPMPSEYEWAPRILGVDVARFGDDRTVLFPRQGLVAFRPLIFRDLDTMETAEATAKVIRGWQPDSTQIDVTGGLGAGPYDRLRQLGYSVLPVEFGMAAASPRYETKRDEIWGLMRDWLRDGGTIPNIPELISELAGPSYSFTPRSRMKVESKRDMKARGLASPDIADALACTFCHPVAPRAVTTVWGGGRSDNAFRDYNPLEGKT